MWPTGAQLERRRAGPRRRGRGEAGPGSRPRKRTYAPRPVSRHETRPSICIVGAGFGGIGLAIRLKEAGFDDLTILEKGETVGGVWRDNTYPGLTCDVPSHLYSLSFAPKHDWSRRFPQRDEIHAYLESCVERYGLGEHLRLGTEVAAAEFDEAAGRWRIRTADGRRDRGRLPRLRDRASSRARRCRRSRGSTTSTGRCFHSARWDHDVELDRQAGRGRRCRRELDPVRARDRPRGGRPRRSSSARRTG